jgi:selenocysteine-specific elongation factor
VAQEIRQFVAGTFLQGAPILPISNITGQGFEEFYEALKAMVAAITPRTANGVFRVPVERAFAAKGYGTIVAGIPTCGSVAIGDEVELLPQRKKGRVRAVQVYGRDSTHAMAGQCAAINVPQWDHKDIERGNVVTVSDYFAPGQWYLCQLKLLDYEKADLKNGARVKFHTGTSETTAGVYLFQEGTLKPGRQCLIQVFLNDPVVAGPRDHFILRSLSPVRTLGGGMVIEAIDRRLKRTHSEIVADVAERARAAAVPKAFVEYCVRTAETVAADERQLSLRTKTPLKELAPLLAELAGEGRILPLSGKVFIHVDTAGRVRQQLLHVVRDFHRQRPESPGITREQLLTDSAVRKDVFDALIEKLRSEGKLVERKGCLAVPEHREQFNNAEQKLLHDIETMFKSRPFDPPAMQEVADRMRITQQQLQRAIRILSEQQRLIRVEQDLYFHAEAVAAAREKLVAYIKEKGGLESVQFKYVLDTSRKYAIPLLDYFDKIGVTRRMGYTRLLK